MDGFFLHDPSKINSYGAYSDSFGCFSCLNECITCLGPSSCETCIDVNAFPNSSQRCTCYKGYYQLINNSCQKCPDDCADCVSQTQCIECHKENTVIIKGKCYCEKGFYGVYPLIYTECQKCPDDCTECLSFTFCTECLQKNAISVQGSCECKQGFYGYNNSLNDSCQNCPDDCIECISFNECTKCLLNNTIIVKGKLEKGEEYSVFDDQVRTPTFVEDLAAGIVSIIEKKATGIYHLSGEDILTPYEIACKTAEHLGLDKSLIKKVTAETFSQPAKRPAKTVFNIEKAKRGLNYSPTSFAEGLKKTFAD